MKLIATEIQNNPELIEYVEADDDQIENSSMEKKIDDAWQIDQPTEFCPKQFTDDLFSNSWDIYFGAMLALLGALSAGRTEFGMIPIAVVIVGMGLWIRGEISRHLWSIREIDTEIYSEQHKIRIVMQKQYQETRRDKL